MASMIYFDSDMSKSKNTVVYFDWKMVIYIYAAHFGFLIFQKWAYLMKAIQVFQKRAVHSKLDIYILI
jgi:hypothetical protein